jgi:hypothetical protein
MYSYREHPGFSDKNLSDSEIECGSNSPTCSSSFSEYADHALNDSGIIPNLEELTTSEPTGQEHHRMLLVLPPSPKEDHLRSPSEIAAIATTMMELQTLEDKMLEKIQTMLRLSPESAPQLDKYISRNVRERLKSTTSVFLEAAPNFESHDVTASNFDDEIPGLVPFEHNRKETRKPSYGIR